MSTKKLLIPMLRIGGFGTAFAGINGPDAKGNCIATQWIFILFLPILPLARFQVKAFEEKFSQVSFVVIDSLPLSFNEILKTYFYGWLVFPLVVFLPFSFLIFWMTPEAARFVNLPEWMKMFAFVAAIFWLVLCVLKLKKRDFSRWFLSAG